MNNKIFTGIVLVVLIGGVGFLLMPKKTSMPQQPTVTTQNNDGDQAPATAEKLAGNTSSYASFTQASYEQALSEGKIIFLDFYATWCPICRAEAPEIQAGFDSLDTDKIAGFRVNFNDEDTDEHEKTLAKEYNVPYQHTKIILKDGKEVLRSGDQWDKDTFLQEINKLVE